MKVYYGIKPPNKQYVHLVRLGHLKEQHGRKLLRICRVISFAFTYWPIQSQCFRVR